MSPVVLLFSHPGLARAFEPPPIFQTSYIEQGRAPSVQLRRTSWRCRFKKPPPLVKFVRVDGAPRWYRMDGHQ